MNSNTLFSKYIDGYNLIVQRREAGGDPGDSCHRTMNTLAALKMLGEDTSFDNQWLYPSYIRCKEAMQRAPGTYARHANTEAWYGRPENFSRDQCVMLLWAMLTFGDQYAAKDVFMSILSRKGLNQNTHPNHCKPGDAEYVSKMADPMTPGQLALCLRAMNVTIAYPLIVLLDAFMLIDIPLNMLDDKKSKAKGKRSDAWTMMAALALSTKQKYDNPVAWLARKLLAKTDYKSAIEWIFATPENNDPPIHEIMLPLCEKYIDRNEAL